MYWSIRAGAASGYLTLELAAMSRESRPEGRVRPLARNDEEGIPGLCLRARRLFLPAGDFVSRPEQILAAKRFLQVHRSSEGFRDRRRIVAAGMDERHVVPVKRFGDLEIAIPTKIDVEHRADEALAGRKRQSLGQVGHRSDDLGPAPVEGPAEVVCDIVLIRHRDGAG